MLEVEGQKKKKGMAVFFFFFLLTHRCLDVKYIGTSYAGNFTVLLIAAEEDINSELKDLEEKIRNGKNEADCLLQQNEQIVAEVHKKCEENNHERLGTCYIFY